MDHDGKGIFYELPALLQSTRYHSLAATLLTLPKELAVTATTQESGVIMGVRHREYSVEAVQYHPESCMSEGGRGMMANFLKMRGGYWAENDWCGIKAEPKAESSVKLPTILDRIHAQRLVDVEASSSTPSSTPAIIRQSLSLHTAPTQINLVQRITSTPHTAVMAEIKRASPSKGDISIDACAPAQALKYALAGASVISVLTEPKWFKGGLTDMLAVRQAIDSLPNRPAVLRKDFILAPYQIDEARLYGADTVLLIVAMLTPQLLNELYTYSLSLGMEPLVEVNNPEELQLALSLGAKVIGVNNRNLHDFVVDMETTSRVNAALDGKDVILCALSGISGPEDVEKYVKEGVRAVLVGEALMRAEDTGTFLRKLIDLSPTPRPTPTRPLVKICGIRSVADAKVAITSGADLLGVILVPGTKRCIPLSLAKEISDLVRSSRTASTLSAQGDGWFNFHSSRLLSRRKPLLVGVFRDQPLEDILSAIDEAGLDMVQLHGDEPQSWANFIPVPVIKCFRITPDGQILGGEVNRPGLHQYILLDTAGGGGEGKAFPWEHAKKIIEQGQAGIEGRLPVILAGGLAPDNVKKAIEASGGVLGVDVASGVEGDQGKDKDLVEGFIRAARG